MTSTRQNGAAVAALPAGAGRGRRLRPRSRLRQRARRRDTGRDRRRDAGSRAAARRRRPSRSRCRRSRSHRPPPRSASTSTSRTPTRAISSWASSPARAATLIVHPDVTGTLTLTLKQVTLPRGARDRPRRVRLRLSAHGRHIRRAAGDAAEPRVRDRLLELDPRRHVAHPRELGPGHADERRQLTSRTRAAASVSGDFDGGDSG